MKLLILKSIVELETQRISMEKQIAETRSSLGKIREDLLAIPRAIKVEREVAEAKAQLAKTATGVYFEAWIPSAQVKEAINRIKEATEGNCLVVDEPPRPGEKCRPLL